MDQDIVKRLAQQIGGSVIGLGSGARGGSGVVVATDRVLTLARNLHAPAVEVRFGGGRRADGEVLGTDWDVDLAVVAVSTADAQPVPWAPDGAELAIGSPVVALGDPAGQGLRVTAGALSAAPRPVRGPRGRLIDGVLEHTAPLPRGAGGGPLVDTEGRLVGLNAVRQRGGLLLAWPASALRERARALLAGQATAPRRLGVVLAPPRLARRLRASVGLPEQDGLLVRAVDDAGAAQSAGLLRGDLIVEAGGRPVRSVDDLYAALDAAGAAKPLTLSVLRGTDQRELSVSFDGDEEQS
jgi:S1-C subfamily serine protease